VECEGRGAESIFQEGGNEKRGLGLPFQTALKRMHMGMVDRILLQPEAGNLISNGEERVRKENISDS